MNLFSHKETDLQRRQNYKPGFHVSATSCFCSAHFDDSFYDVYRALAKARNMKRRLKEDAVPAMTLEVLTSRGFECIQIQGKFSPHVSQIALQFFV